MEEILTRSATKSQLTCDVCENVFITENSLKRHFWSIHENSGKGTLNSTIHEGDKADHTCEFCGKLFNMMGVQQTQIVFNNI